MREFTTISVNILAKIVVFCEGKLRITTISVNLSAKKVVFREGKVAGCPLGPVVAGCPLGPVPKCVHFDLPTVLVSILG